ncbi:MAG: hypothetical protein H8E10_16130 [Desulfobacterales bacterium]|nr:hypothetical protein [Desulfobacterales bacterium]
MAGPVENLMVQGNPICLTLQIHYNLPASEKQKFIDAPEAQFLFGSLPEQVGDILREGFVSGTHGINMPGWETVLEYFHANSDIIPALAKNPGTFTMLEKMYHF